MAGTIGVAVVGCGYWGPNLIRNFSVLPDCQVMVVCDTDEKRLSHIKRLYPSVDTVTDYTRVVARRDVDAIAIATPVYLHHEMALQSLSAGKHTFIEKPMASSSQQCAELVNLAEKKDLILMVGHTFLYSPAIRRIKEIVDNGDIGQVRYICSRRLNLGLFQKDINVVWDLAPHDISIILYITGEMPIAVNCQGNAHVTKGVEDVANMSLIFPRQGFAIVHSSWLDPKKVREMTIVGDRRMIVFDDLEPLQKIRIYDLRVDTPPHYDNFAEFHYSYHYGDMYAPYVKQDEPLKLECQHFLDCIHKGEEPLTSGRRGLEVVQILEAACESLKKDGERTLIQPHKTEVQGKSKARRGKGEEK